MTDIYDQHHKAFANVGAYVICKNNERVATIAFKFPKDGAGRLWVYVHFIDVPMVRAYAGGYGYDKKSAAVESAVEKLTQVKSWSELDARRENKIVFFLDALKDLGGKDWHDALRDAGFIVLQAV